MLFKNLGLSVVVRRALSSPAAKVAEKFCAIIGSGPAGFYTAQGLLKSDKVNTHIHVFEKLPVPFGLVRYGIAPDHPDAKNVVNKFSKTASHQHFRFFGNIELGKDMTIDTLRKAYDAVVLCYGCGSENKLNVPGEDSIGVHSAQSFVGWYNGLPKFANLHPNFSTSSAVVIGHGNVAVDVARMMLTSVDQLSKTDISSDAVNVLRKSQVKTVYLVGRRGPLQAAFKIAELRELLKLPGVSVHFDPAHFAGIKERIDDVPRPKRRLVELMLKHLDAQRPPTPDKKCLKIEFFKSPLEIKFDKENKATAVRFNQTALVNPGDLTAESKVKALPGQEVTIEAGLVVRSIGFRGIAADPALPFDSQTGAIRNDGGRVRGLPGVYCAGWIGCGAVGVIADTLANASQVAKIIGADLANKTATKSEKQATEMAECRDTLLAKLEKKPSIDWAGWEQIDAAERKMAEELMGLDKKPREKIRNVDEMVRIASRK